MSDSTAGPRPPEYGTQPLAFGAQPPAYGSPPPPAYGAPPPPAYGAPPSGYGAAPVPAGYGSNMPGAYSQAPGPVGAVRSTGTCILLMIVTLGIYGLFWYFKVHDEMKRHTGSGLGGGIALLIAFFIGFVMPYITSSEVGELYSRRGLAAPVSGLTGLWYFPGMLILVGPIVWFVKTNGALNAYWRSLGAV